MKRITEKDLQHLVDQINALTNSPSTPYGKNTDGKPTANIGCFHLDYAYGGVSLHQMVSVGGGTKDVFQCGHTTKRELYNRLNAYIMGCKERDKK